MKYSIIAKTFNNTIYTDYFYDYDLDNINVYGKPMIKIKNIEQMSIISKIVNFKCLSFINILHIIKP